MAGRDPLVVSCLDLVEANFKSLLGKSRPAHRKELYIEPDCDLIQKEELNRLILHGSAGQSPWLYWTIRPVLYWLQPVGQILVYLNLTTI